MSRVEDLKKAELKRFARDAAALISAGSTPNKVASEFNWLREDVEELLRTDEFEKAMKTLDPYTWQALQETEGDIFTLNAKQFVRDKAEDYIELLDDLARHSKSDQVRLNAVTKLLAIGDIGKAEVAEEIVSVPESHWKRMEQSLEAVLKNGPTGIRQY